MKSILFLYLALPLGLGAGIVSADYAAWKQQGSLYILTTEEGADLPASAAVEGFPLLLRLHKDFFDFAQARPNGEDLRFSGSDGRALAYQIEHWDPVLGEASIWMRIPRIEGNARQQIQMHWGKADASSESDGAKVFNASNGYVSVWHLGDAVKDEVGTLESEDVGTTATPGMIGNARHFPGKKGVFCGDKIPNYPSGNSAHSTALWFRAARPNSTVIGWGNEGGGRGSKIRMQFRSPPHIHIDSDFSDIKAGSRLPMNEWVHVAHTYGDGPRRIYINGKLDGEATTKLDIKSPGRLWLGGWYHNYDFVGDIDEVRISRVARSPDWVRLAYENQKPLQTLVGPLVQAGDALSVTPARITVPEGGSVTVSAQAGGSQKIYWSIIREGRETVVATDRRVYKFDAGRVTGDETATLRLKAIYADGIKTRDVAITITESIAEPEFTLRAPAKWDGRTIIEIVPQLSAGSGALSYAWQVSPIAVIKEAAPGRLILKRAQNSGMMTVTATVSNGGKPTTHSVRIEVAEPHHDAWLARPPGPDERPEDGQFYARDDKGVGRLFYNGTLSAVAESVYLNLYADGKLAKTETAKPAADMTYSLSAELRPGLIKYRTEFGTVTGGRESVLHSAEDIVCGDAYLINGQSNAVATDWGKGEPTYHSEWLRSFGSASGSTEGLRLWGEATHRSRDREKLQIGYWGMELGQRLVETHKIPILLINGAVGGTRIDQHQRKHANPEDMTTIYGRLLWRVRQAKLAHGIRAVIWHQGENDQGAACPTGGYGWETYRQYFIDLAAAWKQDYPNVQHYYAFQIWPKACSMGIDGSDNRLREVQRTLPTAFSNMSVLSTLGIDPPGTCHYPAAGYAEFARFLYPLIARDHYGVEPTGTITPPDLKRASFADKTKAAIVLEFDQPVEWDDALADQFYLDGEGGKVATGSVAGKVLTLALTGPSPATTVTYLDSKRWSPKILLRGENGIAALTFCEVPILPAKASKL